jgi:hypothetical protein
MISLSMISALWLERKSNIKFLHPRNSTLSSVLWYTVSETHPKTIFWKHIYSHEG